MNASLMIQIDLKHPKAVAEPGFLQERKTPKNKKQEIQNNVPKGWERAARAFHRSPLKWNIY